MITKNEILTIAKKHNVLPTTIQKDYIIGWLLYSISKDKFFSKWVFKGGTCLKKCYFETYRFSEDLDFTVPGNKKITVKIINKNLERMITKLEEKSGIMFPRKDWKIEEYENLRSNISYQIKISYIGPLIGAPNSLPRVKFDITQDEIISSTPEVKSIHHNYSDNKFKNQKILCYSINEILAEKSRALVERKGRARDVYDVVNIYRVFKNFVDPKKVKRAVLKKFKYKNLPTPSLEYIISNIDLEMLKSNWEHQLSHQIPILPPVNSYIEDIKNAISWWLEPKKYQILKKIPKVSGKVIPRELFPKAASALSSIIEKIRFASQNKLCVLISYNNSDRLIEAYSLRFSKTRNKILHGWEIEKDNKTINKQKNYNLDQITSATITNQLFSPRWEIEL